MQNCSSSHILFFWWNKFLLINVIIYDIIVIQDNEVSSSDWETRPSKIWSSRASFGNIALTAERYRRKCTNDIDLHFGILRRLIFVFETIRKYFMHDCRNVSLNTEAQLLLCMRITLAALTLLYESRLCTKLSKSCGQNKKWRLFY